MRKTDRRREKNTQKVQHSQLEMGSENVPSDKVEFHANHDQIDVLHTGEKNPRFAPPDRYSFAFLLMGIMGKKGFTFIPVSILV